MAELWNKKITKKELLKHVGDISQICGIKYSELKNGVEKGVESLDFRTGTGFGFSVNPTRGMDISFAEYKGKSLCWRSSTKTVSPNFFNPEGYNWLRNFFGGLLTTCGLTYVGHPCEDQGEKLGLHGRISNIPASNVCFDEYWKGEEYIMYASGKVLHPISI